MYLFLFFSAALQFWFASAACTRVAHYTGSAFCTTFCITCAYARVLVCSLPPAVPRRAGRLTRSYECLISSRAAHSQLYRQQRGGGASREGDRSVKKGLSVHCIHTFAITTTTSFRVGMRRRRSKNTKQNCPTALLPFSYIAHIPKW